MQDKRKIERFYLKLPSQIKISEGGADETILELATENVSSEGAFYPDAVPFPAGTRVTVRMALPLKRFQVIQDLPESVLVTIDGKILRTSDIGTAVRFNKHYTFDQPPASGPQVLTPLAGNGETPLNSPGGTP